MCPAAEPQNMMLVADLEEAIILSGYWILCLYASISASRSAMGSIAIVGGGGTVFLGIFYAKYTDTLFCVYTVYWSPYSYGATYGGSGLKYGIWNLFATI